ncbi:hypothetical protein Rhe02_97580 [Rhizocola hellebori]|uniref:Uncharacterized protein n=2 Tax=Rhizocola hellebori TaxID=1392758 RepID=A0A8J3QMD8_9ACTN|nr:hypothetical protein Rhe02_97580 [Rhizocola hellebori]
MEDGAVAPVVQSIDLTGPEPVINPKLVHRSTKEISVLALWSDARVEFANPALADVDYLHWKTTKTESDPVTPLRPRVTFVDDGRAAQVENAIFSAGVWAGLAAAIVILAVERFPWAAVRAVVRQRRVSRRWRREVDRARKRQLP